MTMAAPLFAFRQFKMFHQTAHRIDLDAGLGEPSSAQQAGIAFNCSATVRKRVVTAVGEREIDLQLDAFREHAPTF